MFEIAGGIILAVMFFFMLPFLLALIFYIFTAIWVSVPYLIVFGCSAFFFKSIPVKDFDVFLYSLGTEVLYVHLALYVRKLRAEQQKISYEFFEGHGEALAVILLIGAPLWFSKLKMRMPKIIRCETPEEYRAKFGYTDSDND